MIVTSILLLICFALVAFLYASVGHGGASGYLAVMAILGYAQTQAKPDALILNIAVSGIAFFHFYRSGFFVRRDFLWLSFFSVPMALLGGLTPLSDHIYHRLLSAMLLLAAFFIVFKPAESLHIRRIPAFAAAAIGMGIGLLSGLTGIGGGVILSPLMLLAGWASQKQAAALSAAFILVNSISGLTGWLSQNRTIDENLIFMLPVVLAGGFAGSYLGANQYRAKALKWLLALVLFVASVRLFLQ